MKNPIVKAQILTFRFLKSKTTTSIDIAKLHDLLIEGKQEMDNLKKEIKDLKKNNKEKSTH